MTMDPELLASWLVEGLVHNWALMSIVCTLTVLLIVPAVVLRRYVKLIINIFDETPPPLAMDPRDYDRLEGQPVLFRAFDGAALRGMILHANPDRSTKGMVLFAHEYGSNAYSCARYCRPLLEAGYDVLTFDFRGHGRSGPEQGYKPRQWPSDREQSDMLGAIAFAEDYLERQGRPRDLGLFGISRGGGAAILAAVGVESVQAILTDGAFSSDSTLEYLMQRWVSIFAKVRLIYENHPPTFWRFLRWLTFRACRRRFHCRYPSVRKAILRLGPTPMFFIHGERDSYIPIAQSQILYDLAQGPKFLWIVPGAKHNQSVIQQPQQYADRTVRFFDQFLARDRADTEPLPACSLSELTQPLADPRAAREPASPRALASPEA
jgi:pimeloyl-ACP methyl ester carboxylesterase